MEQLTQTIGNVSREILHNFTRKSDANGRKLWELREDIEWQHHVILDALGKRMPSPDFYGSAFKVLLQIFVASNVEEAEELLLEMEPHSEIGELTEWLNADPGHVQYLTAALQAETTVSGLELLSNAYNIYLQEIGFNLIKSIRQHIDSAEAVSEVN